MGSPDRHKLLQSRLCYLNILFQLNKPAFKPGSPLVEGQLGRQFSKRV